MFSIFGFETSNLHSVTIQKLNPKSTFLISIVVALLEKWNLCSSSIPHCGFNFVLDILRLLHTKHWHRAFTYMCTLITWAWFHKFLQRSLGSIIEHFLLFVGYEDAAKQELLCPPHKLQALHFPKVTFCLQVRCLRCYNSQQ